MSITYKVVVAITSAAVTGIGGYCIYAKSKKHKGNIESRQVNATGTVGQAAQNVFGQADAVIVDAVNASRINQLLQKLAIIDKNKAGADEEIRILKAEIQKLLTTNRGGTKGIHGFIGETSQVHISNIKAFINGDEPLYILLDDNSMTDYMRGFEIIQQKACRAGGHLGLDAIKHHMEKYPEFIQQGGIYQIPKDMHTKYEYLRNLPEDVATKLRKEDLRLWKYIHTFAEENPDVVIEPMEVSYTDIQAGNIDNTIERVEKNTEQEFKKQRKVAQAEHAPNFEEFLKICSISAAIEGGISAGSEFVRKIQSGKKLTSFTKQDWKDIGAKLMLGSGTGALRGGILYIATNIYKLPASIVSGVVTALFGICQEGYRLFKKRISRKEFINSSILIAFQSISSMLGAFLGKKLCKKHPMLGSIIGSLIGTTCTNFVGKVAFA